MRFFRDILLVALVITAAILGLEGALRLARVRVTASFFRPDPVRGYALRPNSQGWVTDENEVYRRINSDGMRDRERSVDAAPGTVRIAVLGSSEAEARQVPLDQTFESLMEKELSRATGRPVEVLNFGVAGYTLAQEYLTLRDHVWKYQPQVVLLTFTTENVLQNTKALYSGEPAVPFFELQGNGLFLDPPKPQLVATNHLLSRLNGTVADYMNRSSLLSLANAARVSLLRWSKAVLVKPPSKIQASLLPSLLDPRDAPYRFDPRLQEAWAVNDSLFRLMRNETERHGAEFWVVLIPLNIQIHPDLERRAKVERELELPSLYGADHRLEDFAKSEGINLLLLAPVLGGYAAEHNRALCGFWNTPFNSGHFNEEGHRVIAHAISENLLRQSVAFQRLPGGPASTSSTSSLSPPLSHAMRRPGNATAATGGVIRNQPSDARASHVPSIPGVE